MRLRVLYFAAVRELVARDEEAVDVPDSVRDIGALRVWLEGHRAELAGRLGSVRLARNEAFAADGDAIERDDVIALIPPVAGG